ncbi:hypothetical protein RM764_41650, partial [Streptomyces sp. DSM 41699]|nr:hypothetical protein [Streptomyces sp. DSM 41699]
MVTVAWTLVGAAAHTASADACAYASTGPDGTAAVAVAGGGHRTFPRLFEPEALPPLPCQPPSPTPTPTPTPTPEPTPPPPPPPKPDPPPPPRPVPP